MKKNRFLAIFVTLAFLGTLLLPTLAFAAGLTSNYVEREVNVNDDEDFATFGSLVIREGEDFANTFSEDETSPSVITITLVDGVEFNEDTIAEIEDDEDVSGITDGSSDTLEITCKSISDNSATFEVYSTEQDAEKEKLRINFDELAIDSDFSGAVKVRVDSLDGNITSGEYVIGNVLGSECVATAVNKPDVAVGDTDVKLGTIRITENAVGALCDDGEIDVTLPDEYKWADVKLGGSLADAVDVDVDEADDEELTFYTSNIDLGYRGILDITPIVDIPYDAEPGDCSVEVKGDGDLDMSTVDLVLADVKDFGNTVSIKKVKEFYAGAYDEELDKITVESNAEGSLISGRYIIAELSGNAKFTYDYAFKNDEDVDADNAEDMVPDFGDFVCTDVTDNKIVWKTTEDVENETEFSVDKLSIALSLNQPGDVTMKFSGTAGVDGELVVAKSLAPVTATVENPTEVKIGVQNQVVGDITVKESGAEAIAEGDNGAVTTLTLRAPEGVKFAARPTAEVVEGDLELENNGLVYLRDIDGDDGQWEEVQVKIDNESSTASSVKFSNIKLSVDRGFPEGGLTLKVAGTSVVEQGSLDMFNVGTAANAVCANVITPAPNEQANGMFFVGNTLYNINGQMSMMDVAPYNKNGRVYVPLRYLAYVCGLNDSGIVWDEATQTVTLTKGATVVKLVVGSTTLTVNDAPTTMDVVPEITNDRTMLPARFVAEAFGGTVTWSATSNAVGIQF